MERPRDIIFKILQIIGYKDDKDKFVEDFLRIIDQKTMIDCLSLLSQDKQRELTGKLNDNPDYNLALLKQYLSQEKVEANLRNNAKEVLGDYLKTVFPLLSKDQINSINSFFQQLQTST